ncbi:MAG: hypothetical protein ACKOEM_01625, partial [Planctomycetia bacterium]
LRRLQADQIGGVPVPEGEYVVRLTAVKQATSRRGHPLRIAVFEVGEGPHGGARIETPVWGHAETLVNAAAGAGGRFSISVYAHRVDGGREYRRVNVEAIRKVGTQGEGVSHQSVEALAVEHIETAAEDFTRCFRCAGSIGSRREIVDWQEQYAAMARCVGGWRAGEVVYLSTFTFTTAIDEHQSENDRKAEAEGKPRKGSLENFHGACFAPLLTFDTDCRDADGKPDPAGCHESAVALVAGLLELGVPPDLIWPFYSGSKGFHVQMPSMLAGAAPAVDFHRISKQFCSIVADQAGVVIDESLYKRLQPLRAPNSRHESSGLYKVRLTLDELIDLPFEEIRGLAEQPRPFDPPSCRCEPVPAVATLWQQSMQAARTATAFTARGTSGAGSDAKITRATWDYLLNGVEPGSRAESHFRAAANLADFGSIEQLVHALMKRPADRGGLPGEEAEAHVESALRRAAARQHPEHEPGRDEAQGN